MATKKITLNELRSLVKQIIKEETMLNEGLKLRNNTATKKITLNELRTLVKQVVKEYDLAWDNIDPQGYDYVDKIAASFIDLTKKYGIVGLPYDDYYFNGDIEKSWIIFEGAFLAAFLIPTLFLLFDFAFISRVQIFYMSMLFFVSSVILDYFYYLDNDESSLPILISLNIIFYLLCSLKNEQRVRVCNK
jgi:hypothetical protein